MYKLYTFRTNFYILMYTLFDTNKGNKRTAQFPN